MCPACRRVIFRVLGLSLVAVLGSACGALRSVAPAPADLAIIHARVLDVRTGQVRPETTVLMRGGTITAVRVTVAADSARAVRVVDAQGRLLTPGLTDVHLHTHLLLQDAVTGGPAAGPLLVMAPDSIAAYRRRFAAAYLPYGVTLVRDVGSSERRIPMLREWMARSPDAPDFYPSGAYLVSPESGRTPVAFGVAVADSADAAAKVRQYHELGFQNVKLYWRLHAPEFRAALAEADRLGMTTTAHVDQDVMTIGQALGLGLKHVEHVHTVPLSVMPDSEVARFYQALPTIFGPTVTQTTPGLFDLLIPEGWLHLGPNDPRVLALLDTMREEGASVTPTLHLFGQRLGLTYFASPPWDAQASTAGFTPAQRARAVAGYRIMASYVKRAYERGVSLNLGTDSPDPGKAVLSEMLLLHEAGIPMAGVFRIATLNSAEDIGQGAAYGAVEPGRRANLVLFDGDPLARATDLLGGKVVIKDGVIWSERQ